MNKQLWSFVAILSLISVGCSSSNTHLKKGKTLEGEVVEAEGQAPYNSADLAGTKAASLAAAQRAAIDLVVGVYVTASTRVEKAVAIEQNILTRSSGYIKRYEVLSEGRSGEWYKTRIRALVSTKDLREDLDSKGLLRQAAIGHPRVALYLQEYIKERPSKDGSATRALSQVLLDKGFKVVALPAQKEPDADAADVARTLSRDKVELLLGGFARAQSMGEEKKLGGMSSLRATISFRVIEAGTGEVIQTISQVASGIEATPELAAQKAFEGASELAAKDLGNLPGELSKRAHVDLSISGLKSFTALSKLQKSLVAMPGVKDLYLRSFNQESGVAVLDVMADQVSPQELADQAIKVGGSDWSIYQVSGRSVQLNASQAGR